MRGLLCVLVLAGGCSSRSLTEPVSPTVCDTHSNCQALRQDGGDSPYISLYWQHDDLVDEFRLKIAAIGSTVAVPGEMAIDSDMRRGSDVCSTSGVVTWTEPSVSSWRADIDLGCDDAKSHFFGRRVSASLAGAY